MCSKRLEFRQRGPEGNLLLVVGRRPGRTVGEEVILVRGLGLAEEHGEIRVEPWRLGEACPDCCPLVSFPAQPLGTDDLVFRLWVE